MTLLFSREHYLAAADAYLRGIERRIAAGLAPDVGSVASLFISRWDVAVAGKVPPALANRLGIAIGQRSYKAYCDLVATPRYRRVMNAGGRPQRLLFASTGTKDPKASDVHVRRGARRAVHGEHDSGGHAARGAATTAKIAGETRADGGDCETVLAQFDAAGVDVDALAAQLQDEGAASFVKSWNELMGVLAAKSAALGKAA